MTGSIDTVEFQYGFSFGQLFWYPQAFWGQAADLIATVFGMYNHVYAPDNPPYDHQQAQGRRRGDLRALLPWLGVGGRFDAVQPNLDDSTQNFSVFSPRIILRTDFVTHEQIMVQYSRYFYGDARGRHRGMFPYNGQPGGARTSSAPTRTPSRSPRSSGSRQRPSSISRNRRNHED